MSGLNGVDDVSGNAHCDNDDMENEIRKSGCDGSVIVVWTQER